MDVLRNAVNEFSAKYKHTHPVAKACDACVVFAVASCFLQLLYVALTSSFPFNSLLSALAGSAGFAVLTLCLRMRTTTGTQLMKAPTPQKALAEYAFAMCFLWLLVWNYMG